MKINKKSMKMTKMIKRKISKIKKKNQQQPKKINNNNNLKIKNQSIKN